MRSEGGGSYQVVGLPAKAVTIRNSSRVLAACPRRWWFERGEGLAPKVEARPLSYGTAWHAALEDVHRWWMRSRGEPYREEFAVRCWACADVPSGLAPGPCPSCRGTRLGPIASARLAWVGGDREEDALILERNLDGWLRVHGDRPPDGMRVVGVELGLAMPIRSLASSRGEVYSPEHWIVRRADGTERLARTGEASGAGNLPPGATVFRERRQVWLSVRLDAALADTSDVLYVDEFKASRTPEAYLRGLSVDPQVTCYELVLQHVAREGWLEMPRSRDFVGGISRAATVGGWLYDVASSSLLRDPHTLKEKKDGTHGGFSQAKNLLASVPSWRLEAAYREAGIPLDPAAVSHQRSVVDRRRFLREWGGSPEKLKARTLRELYAEARRQISLHRAAAELRSPDDVDVAFPRVPICRQPGGRCAFLDPCFDDGPQARSRFVVRDGDEERDAEEDYGGDEEPSDA